MFSPRQGAILIFAFSLATVAAMLGSTVAQGAKVTLGQVCGPEGKPLAGSSPQAEQLCRAAYVSGNGMIINDNNSRVRASVAVVCAYSCVSGGANSCSGGGSPCPSAVDNGHKAYDFSNASDENEKAAQKDGAAAHYLKGNIATLEEQGKGRVGGSSNPSGTGGPAGSSSLPSVCRRASESGSVQDRIDCAATTDPGLPKFVKDPRFTQDFQKATGFPLQQVINQSSETLLNQYAGKAIENSYNSLNGKMTSSQFLANGTKLAKSFLDSFSSEEDRRAVADAILPDMVKRALGLDSGKSGSAVADAKQPKEEKPNGADGPAGELKQDQRVVSAEAAAMARAGTAPAAVQSRGSSGLDPENDPNLSLFVRVSERYRASLERVEKLDWSLTSNRLMNSQ